MQSQSATSAKHTDGRVFSPLKHGLTGRIYLLSQAEQIAYDNLRRGFHDDLAPSGEASLFAEGAEKFAESPEATGDAELDLALSEAAFGPPKRRT